MQYSGFLYIYIIQLMVRNISNKVQIAKNSLSTIVNKLNEALLIRND